MGLALPRVLVWGWGGSHTVDFAEHVTEPMESRARPPSWNAKGTLAPLLTHLVAPPPTQCKPNLEEK